MKSDRSSMMAAGIVVALVVLLGCGGEKSIPPVPTSPPETATRPSPKTPPAAAAPETTAPKMEAVAARPSQTEPGEAGEESDKEGKQETEWIALFNGKDLKGWQNAREPAAENKWSVEDGALTNAEHGNDIGTVEQWKDFELRLEYKTVPDGNSGVYLRGRIEVQVRDSFGKADRDAADDGAIYGVFAPLVNASKPAGEWNTLEVTYTGDTLTAKLNGQLIHDNRQVTQVTGGALPGGPDEEGPLMLQGDHGKVWYRNVELRPILARTSE